MTRKITIVGDSLAQWSDGFGLRSRLPAEFSVTDVSVAGYTTEDWLQNKDQLNRIPTDLWILELGTNDAMAYGTNGYESRTLDLINFLQSNQISIVYLTLIPRTNMTSIKETIRENNETLRKIKLQKEKVDIVDIESIFESYQGEIPLYPISDPIHPNQIGYDLMGETYRKKILGI
ncbi:SGNH/GDSL hydrolase family protein [Leptospira jelokensis]|uniref:SGNH/GDSL hydrolase family protein n=2 Tax=Leptospira jelokensis TaxID=2484931 RepID=A0A4Z1A7R7_9LEPT|nr:SGNH/GDSL hydrolase family protein [Leptospira jelokensis]TGM02560.1 SGNH/GDSL hydrolase family protein [Leptospira jelokensis]